MRWRTKDERAARALLPEGTTLRAYVRGRAHARMSTGVWVFGGLFAAVFVIAIQFGVLLVPSGLSLAYLIYLVRPPRGIAVTDQGLAVLARSFWSGRPNKVLSLVPPLRLTETTNGRATLALGQERVTLNHANYQTLAAATATLPDPT